MVVHFPATSFINDHSDAIKGYALRHHVKFLVAAERLWEHLTQSRRTGYLEIDRQRHALILAAEADVTKARACAGTAAVISPEGGSGGSSGRGGAGRKQHLPRGGPEDDDDDSADSSASDKGDDHENEVKQKSRKSLRDKNAPKKKSKQPPAPLPGRGSNSNNKKKQTNKKASISAKADNKKKWSTRTGGATGRTISWNIFLKGTKMNSSEASVYWKKLTKAEKDAFYDSQHQQELKTEDEPLKEEEDEVDNDHSMEEEEAHDDNDGERVKHTPDQDKATTVTRPLCRRTAVTTMWVVALRFGHR